MTAKPPPRKGPRLATARYLENAALHYLERFASSSANLKRVLMRKVARSARFHGTDPAEGERLVDGIIVRYLEAGLLDDRAYAAQKAASLRRRGGSRYGIRGKLVQKGVEAELIQSTLDQLDEEEGAGDLAAAWAPIARPRRAPNIARKTWPRWPARASVSTSHGASSPQPIPKRSKRWRTARSSGDQAERTEGACAGGS